MTIGCSRLLDIFRGQQTKCQNCHVIGYAMDEMWNTRTRMRFCYECAIKYLLFFIKIYKEYKDVPWQLYRLSSITVQNNIFQKQDFKVNL